SSLYLFFFNDTATTEIYTLSLHDALPILRSPISLVNNCFDKRKILTAYARDRKSTRLNSSHTVISYAVFCLKHKKTQPPRPNPPHSNALVARHTAHDRE